MVRYYKPSNGLLRSNTVKDRSEKKKNLKRVKPKKRIYFIVPSIYSWRGIENLGDQ